MGRTAQQQRARRKGACRSERSSSSSKPAALPGVMHSCSSTGQAAAAAGPAAGRKWGHDLCETVANAEQEDAEKGAAAEGQEEGGMQE
jgi:hypothetical protein